MAAASIQQDKADTPFIRITIFNPDLLNKTDKVKVMVDADWITSAAINQHSTVDIPLDHSPSPETLQLHFVDQKGNIHYDIHTV